MGNAVRIRRAVIAAVAVTAGAAALHFAPRPGEESTLRAATPDAGRAAAKPKDERLAEIAVPSRDGLSSRVRADLFPGPPPVRPREVAPAPVVIEKPTVPPFPYKFGGRLDAGNGAIMFLQKGSELVAIKKGELLDGVWRIEAVTDDRIEVSFVPLGERLALSFASLTAETAAQSGRYADVPAAGRALSNTPTTDVAAAPARAASAAAPLVGGMGISAPPAAAPVQPGARRGATLAAPPPAALPIVQTSPTQTSPMQPGPAPSGAMPSSAAPTGRLGTDAPSQGSMPMGGVGSSGSMPTGNAPLPTGKLGH
jgi:hypothetical protein